MKKTTLILFATFIVALMLLTTSCGGKEELKIYNWGHYIDPEVITDFEKEFNVGVIYDEFDNNEDMYIKIDTQTKTYDIVCPSEYTLERMILNDLVAPLDLANIPNYKNIAPEYLNTVVDPENQYALPYMVGTLGILYNTKMVNNTVDSWDVLWNEKYKGQIFIWDSMRDAFGMAFKKLGYSMNESDPKRIEEARDLLIAQRPLVQAYLSDEIRDKMIAEEGALALMYSGDACQAMAENEALEYIVPKEGSNKWADYLCIPKTSDKKALAEKFINFLCRTDIAARNMEYIGYTSPVTDAASPEIASNEAMFPPAEVVNNCEAFRYDPESVLLYDRAWTEVKVSK